MRSELYSAAEENDEKPYYDPSLHMIISSKKRKRAAERSAAATSSNTPKTADSEVSEVVVSLSSEKEGSVPEHTEKVDFAEAMSEE